MPSSHPSFESLLTFSQHCLEGFELARRDQACSLRRELRDVVEEWIEFEIEARLARWIRDCRAASDGESASGEQIAPALAAPEFALRGLAHGASERDAPLPFRHGAPAAANTASAAKSVAATACRESADEIFPEPSARLTVSQNAAVALQSLERCAQCTAQSLGTRRRAALHSGARCLSPAHAYLPFRLAAAACA